MVARSWERKKRERGRREIPHRAGGASFLAVLSCSRSGKLFQQFPIFRVSGWKSNWQDVASLGYIYVYKKYIRVNIWKGVAMCVIPRSGTYARCPFDFRGRLTSISSRKYLQYIFFSYQPTSLHTLYIFLYIHRRYISLLSVVRRGE